MRYAIYPPIGIGRLGNCPDEFFIAPETHGSVGTEADSAGGEAPVSSFKDDKYRVKRQAARYTLFEVDDNGVATPAILPEGAVIRWSVALANKKDAVVRPGSPPSSPVPVTNDPLRADRQIYADGVVEGERAPAVKLDGTHRSASVNLGQIQTDAEGRLVVLGGSGQSKSSPYTEITSYYNNPNWYDDTCDGPVNATVVHADGQEVVADGAWVIIGPPDFAPAAMPWVTLYDVIRQVAIDNGWLGPVGRPNFETDIRPIIERAASHRWVHGSSIWGMISTDWAALADNTPAGLPLRQETVYLINKTVTDNLLADFTPCDWQMKALAAWEQGDFDTSASNPPDAAAEMTRAVLDTTIGQGFGPGIEAGINITDPNIYTTNPVFEFRLDHNRLGAGDLTALMAQPWQADFHECRGRWWPAQRPDDVPQENGGTEPWFRPEVGHEDLIDLVMKLGIVSHDASGDVAERERDTSLGG